MSETMLQKVADLNNRRKALLAELKHIEEDVKHAEEAYKSSADPDPEVLEHWNVEHEGPIATEEDEPKMFEREKIFD